MTAASTTDSTHPPLLRGFHPDADAMLAQIQPSVVAQAKHILSRIPLFKEENGAFVTTSPAGKKLKLDDPGDRQQVARNAIGDYWELMNLAEFVFKFNKSENAKTVFRIDTTDFNIEFVDYEKCHKFLSAQEAEWEDWAPVANHPAADRPVGIS